MKHTTSHYFRLKPGYNTIFSNGSLPQKNDLSLWGNPESIVQKRLQQQVLSMLLSMLFRLFDDERENSRNYFQLWGVYPGEKSAFSAADGVESKRSHAQQTEKKCNQEHEENL